MEHEKTPTQMSLETMIYDQLQMYHDSLDKKLENREYPNRNKDCVEYLEVKEEMHRREKEFGKHITGKLVEVSRWFGRL